MKGEFDNQQKSHDLNRFKSCETILRSASTIRSKLPLISRECDTEFEDCCEPDNCPINDWIATSETIRNTNRRDWVVPVAGFFVFGAIVVHSHCTTRSSYTEESSANAAQLKRSPGDAKLMEVAKKRFQNVDLPSEDVESIVKHKHTLDDSEGEDLFDCESEDFETVFAEAKSEEEN